MSKQHDLRTRTRYGTTDTEQGTSDTEQALIQPSIIIHVMPTSVAQLNARPTGDQEIAGPTPAGPATFFRGDSS